MLFKKLYVCFKRNFSAALIQFKQVDLFNPHLITAMTFVGIFLCFFVFVSNLNTQRGQKGGTTGARGCYNGGNHSSSFSLSCFLQWWSQPIVCLHLSSAPLSSSLTPVNFLTSFTAGVFQHQAITIVQKINK